MMWPLLLLHISAATVGLLSGYMSMFLPKGSDLHRLTGNIFYGSMLAMTTSAAYIAAFLHPIALNVVVALLTLYLVVTARRAAKRKEGGTGAFDVGALLFVLAVGVAGMALGFEATNSPNGTKHGMPAAPYFIFGVIALLCAMTDVRMLRRGGAVGSRRMVRHLWRMCVALLIATFSLYPGQAKLFPGWLRETNLLVIPHLLLVGSMIFWRIRYRQRKRGSGGPGLPMANTAPTPASGFTSQSIETAAG